MNNYYESLLTTYENNINRLQSESNDLNSKIKVKKSELKHPIKKGLKFIAIANLIMEFILLVPNGALRHFGLSSLVQMIGIYAGLTIYTGLPAIIVAYSTKKKNDKINEDINKLKNNRKDLENQITQLNDKIDEIYNKLDNEVITEDQSDTLTNSTPALSNSKAKVRTLKMN